MKQNNISSAENLYKLLSKKNYTISFAESCTGGLMAASLVDVSGASSIFEYGFVTYSKSSKNEILGVEYSTIDEHGIVSCEVAKAMAIGAIKKSRSDVAISVTGCAGPSKDEEGNEAGTVCFGFIIKDLVITEKVILEKGTRNEVRTNAVEYAFKKAFQLLKGLKD